MKAEIWCMKLVSDVLDFFFSTLLCLIVGRRGEEARQIAKIANFRNKNPQIHLIHLRE